MSDVEILKVKIEDLEKELEECKTVRDMWSSALQLEQKKTKRVENLLLTIQHISETAVESIK